MAVSDSSVRAPLPPGPPSTELVPEGGGGVDLQPDVERIHRAVAREPQDPVEGLERPPWFFTAAVLIALFWGGWYLGRYGGEFNTATHISEHGREHGIAGAAAAQANAAATDPVAAGKNVYAKNCTGCHQTTGLGLPGAFPPLLKSAWVSGPPETVVRILLHGLQGPVQVEGATYNGAMPAWKNVLKDEEIAAVATYVRQWTPNAASPVPVEMVASLRRATASRTAAWSAAELTAAAGSKNPGAARPGTNAGSTAGKVP